MSNLTYDPLTQTYLVRPRGQQFESLLTPLHHPDLVLVCGSERLAYNSEMLVALSPVIRSLVQRARDCGCSQYLTREVELFVTLDGVEADVLREIVESLVEGTEVKFNSDKIEEIGDIFRMLGVNKDLFSLKKEKEDDQEKYDDQTKTEDSAQTSSLNWDSEVNLKRKIQEYKDDILKSDTSVTTNEKKMEISIKRRYEEHKDNAQETHDDLEMKSKQKYENISLKKRDSILAQSHDDSDSDMKIRQRHDGNKDSQMNLKQRFEESIDISFKKKESISAQSNDDSETKFKRRFEDHKEIAVKKVKNNEESSSKPHDGERSKLLQRLPPNLIITSVKDDQKANSPIKPPTPVKESNLDTNKKPWESTNNQVTLVKIKKEVFENSCNEPMAPKPMEDGNNEDDDNVLRCPLTPCPSGSSLQMRTRSEVLLHLTNAHYSEPLLDLVPFVSGEPCSLCVEQRTRHPLVAQQQARHLSHVGVNHQLVLTLIPSDLRDLIVSLPRRLVRGVQGGLGKGGGGTTLPRVEEKSAKDTMTKEYTNEKVDTVVKPVGIKPEQIKSEPPNTMFDSDRYSAYQSTFSNREFYSSQGSSYSTQEPPFSSHMSVPASQPFAPEDYSNPSNILAPLSASEFDSFPVVDPSEYSSSSAGTSEYLSQTANPSEYPPPPSQYSSGYPSYPPTYPYQYPAYQHSTTGGAEVEQEPNPESAGMDKEPSDLVNENEDDYLTAGNQKSNSSELVQSLVSDNSSENSSLIPCSLCSSSRTFSSQSEFLFHLSIAHFSRNIVGLHPYKEGQLCPLCSSFTAPSISSHISHLGIEHKLVLTFIADDPEDKEEDSGKQEPPAKQEISAEQESPAKQENSPEQENSANEENSNEKELSDDQAKHVTAAVSTPPAVEKVQCSMCLAPNRPPREFTKRSDLLKHLTLLHCGKQLLKSFPFSPSTPCDLCSQTGRSFLASKKEVWVCHVGVVHSKMFEMLPRDMLQAVKNMPKKPTDAEKKSAVAVVKSTEAPAVPTEVKQDTSPTLPTSTRQPWFTKVDFSQNPGRSDLLDKPISDFMDTEQKPVKEAEEAEDPMARFANTESDFVKQNSEDITSESDAEKKNMKPIEMDDDDAEEDINCPESEVPETAKSVDQAEIDDQEQQAHVAPEEEFDNEEIEKPESEFETPETKESNKHFRKAGGPMEVEDEFLMQETVTLEEESDSQPESEVEDDNSEDEDEVGAGRPELKVLKKNSADASAKVDFKPADTEPTGMSLDQSIVIEDNPQRRPYNCRYCPARFSGPREYKNHLVLHRDQFSLITQTPPAGHMVNLRMGNLKNMSSS